MAKKIIPHTEKNSEQSLLDKVVLIVDGTNQDYSFLAVALAERGADIVIVQDEAQAGLLDETREMVEAEGRRCIILPMRIGDEAASKEVVRQTMQKFGRFDIFIDFSASKVLEFDKHGNADVTEMAEKIEKKGLIPNLDFMSAVLDQLVV